MVAEKGKSSQPPAEEPVAPLGSGIYVDVENLGTAAQEVVRALMESWPDSFPAPSLLSLHVRADQSDLWSMWAESQFPHISVRAKGIQHFSANPAKNSADIAIAIDAMTDFLMRRINCVAVVSDDSDFISLYSKLKDEQDRAGDKPGDVPFLWVVTDRPGTRSSTIKDYFLNNRVHVVRLVKSKSSASQQVEDNQSSEMAGSPRGVTNPVDDMALAIIKGIAVGPFKSAKCWGIVKNGWPDHPIVADSRSAKNKQATFGEKFLEDIFPFLKKRGVIRRSRGYEMTQRAKDYLTK